MEQSVIKINRRLIMAKQEEKNNLDNKNIIAEATKKSKINPTYYLDIFLL